MRGCIIGQSPFFDLDSYQGVNCLKIRYNLEVRLEIAPMLTTEVWIFTFQFSLENRHLLKQ